MVKNMENWIICLEECLPDFGINLDREKIIELAKVMKHNADCISDNEYEMCGGRSSGEPVIDYAILYANACAELESLRNENEAFRNSVARRRNVDPSSVKIEHDRVMFYP